MDSIPDVTQLSLRARIAIGLRLFSAYCQRRSLSHPDIQAFVDHLWCFVGMPDSAEAFNEWSRNEPTLVTVGLGDDYEPAFAGYLATSEVTMAEFRCVIESATEILYSSMFGACDESGSRKYLNDLAGVAAQYGVSFPDIQVFADSRWTVSGWGNVLTAEELSCWKRFE